MPWPCALAGINGAGKTTQLQIIAGNLEPNAGTVAKEKPNMRIAYLTQEFDVVPTRTVRVRRRTRRHSLHLYAIKGGLEQAHVCEQQPLCWA